MQSACLSFFTFYGNCFIQNDVQNDVLLALNEGSAVVLLMLDLSSAFDTIDLARQNGGGPGVLTPLVLAKGVP